MYKQNELDFEVFIMKLETIQNDLLFPLLTFFLTNLVLFQLKFLWNVYTFHKNKM